MKGLIKCTVKTENNMIVECMLTSDTIKAIIKECYVKVHIIKK